MQSRTPRQVDSRQSHCGPVCVAARSGVVGKRGLGGNRTRFRTENFAAAKNFRNFRSESRRKSRASSIPVLARVFEDLFATRRGRASSGSANFGAIARVFGPKILRPRKIFDFGPRGAENRAQTRTPRHADGRQRLCGPVCLAARPGVVEKHGFRRNLTRFRTENFAAA